MQQHNLLRRDPLGHHYKPGLGHGEGFRLWQEADDSLVSNRRSTFGEVGRRLPLDLCYSLRSHYWRGGTEAGEYGYHCIYSLSSFIIASTWETGSNIRTI